MLLTVAETASALHGIPFYLMQSTIKSQTHNACKTHLVKQEFDIMRNQSDIVVVNARIKKAEAHKRPRQY